MVTLTDFHDYVFSFYGRGGVYPMGATLDQIASATEILIDELIDELEATGKEFEGDSVDRKLVRDILISEYGLEWPAN